MNRKINRSMHKGMALFLSLVMLLSIMVPVGIGVEPLPDSTALSVAGAAYDSDPPSVAEDAYNAEEAAGLNILSVTADVYVPPTKWEDYAAASFAGGTGTAEDPYQIATAEQLAYLATLCNTTQVPDTANPDPAKPLYAQKAYIITADIDLSAHLWPRLTSSTSRKFTGSFDGGGHFVAGMVVEIASGSYASLLGYIENAVVKNVHLRNAWISGYTASGGIAGRANNSVVENCTVIGTVKTTRADGGVAGIVGDTNAGGVNISRCAFRGVLEGRTASGITAANGAIIDQCFADAEFNVTDTSYSANTAINGIGKGSISNCYAAGTAESTEMFGRGRNIGINGVLRNNEKIENCYSTLDITGGNYIGGITGEFAPDENSDDPTPLIRGCVALNGMIAADGYRGSPGGGSQYVGRIAGGVASGTNAAGEATHARINTNYAYKGTQVYSRDDNGSGAILRLIGLPAAGRVHTGSQGADITSTDIAEGNWPVEWDRDIWRFEAGKLPTLKNISDQMPQPGEMPAHISAAGEADWHITAFDTDGQRPELPLGCTEADAAALLPATLFCTKDGTTPASIPDVTWTCSNFDGNTVGEYTFTAALPEGYAMSAAPTVTVKVILGYTVAFESNGGSAVEAIRADSGSMIAAPDVTRPGFTFDGWYKDQACTQPWNFATDRVTSSMTLYAKWSITGGVPDYVATQPGVQDTFDVTGMGFMDTFIVSIGNVDGFVTYAVVTEQKIDFSVPAGEYVIEYTGQHVGTKRITQFSQNAGSTPPELSYKGTGYGTADDPLTMIGAFFTKDGSQSGSAPSIGLTFRVLNMIAGYDSEGMTNYGTPYNIMLEDRDTLTGRLKASFAIDGSRLGPCPTGSWYQSPRTYGVVLNPSDTIIANSLSTHSLYNAANYSDRTAAATGALQAVRADEKRVLMYHTQMRDFAGPVTYKLDVSGYFANGDTVYINYLLGAANRSLYHGVSLDDAYMLAVEPIYIKNNTSAVVTGGYLTFDLLNGGYFELVKAEDDDRETRYVVEFDTNGADSARIYPQVLNAAAKVTRPTDPVKEDYNFDGWYSDEGLTSAYDFETPLTQNIVLYARWTEDGDGDDDDGGGGSGGGTVPSYTVTFVTGEDPDSGEPNATIPAQTVKSGKKAKDPGFFDSGFGYLVLAWYTDSKLKNEYDFGNEVTADLTLYPKWMRYILKDDLRKDGGSGSENSPYRAHLANSRQSKIAWKALNEISGHSEWWKVYVTEDNERNGTVRYAWVFNGKDIDTCNNAHPYYTDIALTKRSSDTVQAKFVWRTAIEGKVYVSINVSDYFAEGADAEISYVNGSCDGKVAHTDVESGEWVDSLHHPASYYSGGTSKVKDGFVTLELTHGGTYLIKSTGGGTGGSGTTAAIEEEDENPTVSVYLNPEGEATDGAATVAVTDTEFNGAIDTAVEEKADEIVIAPRITGEAKNIRVELSKTAVQNMVGKTGAALTFETDLAAVTIAHHTLAEVAGKIGDRVIFMIEKISEDTVKFEIRLNVQVLENLKGVKLAIPVAGAGAGMVAVLVKADGSEETIRKSLLDGDQLLALVGGAATVKISDKSKSFRDVDDSFWGKTAVDFATSHELFTGVSEREFGPNGAMTRGMLVTVLHRLENTPAGGNAAFADVDKESWYAQAVAWAAENSLISGMEKGFEPEGKITREQLAAMLYRYAQYVDLDTGIKGDITGFGDAGQISDWAGDAVSWAVGAGLMNGKGDNLLDPKGQATRAEVAAMAYRLIQKMVR
ncbi:MAG: InlB B-repeat-containing protein [Dehalobacterium sp.]